jgi:hypothetical protein
MTMADPDPTQISDTAAFIIGTVPTYNVTRF